MQTIDNVIVYGDPVDDGAMSQIRTSLRTAERACLMADHHKGYAVPIGGVVAYDGAVSPSGVGFDIGCGNKAVQLDIKACDIDLARVLDEAWSVLSFGIGRCNDEAVDSDVFDDPLWSESELLRAKNGKMLQIARNQLGTIGSGNHYVDIFQDDDGYVWIGVHFGSRGFGHKTATYFLEQAGAKDGMDVEPCVLDLDSDLGEQYWKHMELAGRYAHAGRDWVCDRVARIVGGTITDAVHNHHNFAWKEQHFTKEYVVVRKGATPAFPGQRGFVGGSMGDDSVIIEGVESGESQDIMYSTIHGAGRVMSRTQAAGRMNYKTRTRSGGKVTESMMHEWISDKGVQLRGGGCDESPHCYKRLNDVLDHHQGTIRVLRILNPLGVMMAGANEFDPYKD